MRALAYLTLAVVTESHAVAAVRALVPVTRTATHFCLCADVNFNVSVVAFLIFVQVAGTVERATLIARLQTYHW